MRRALALALAFGLVAPLAACSDDGGDADSVTRTGATTTTTPAGPEVVAIVGAEDNRLWAYRPEPPFEKQRVIASQADDPEDGLDINAQICFFRRGDEQLMIAGEDTDQDRGDLQGWGVFRIDGDAVGNLTATEVAKLVPTYQSSTDNAENYGCGVLADGRVVTTDVGNQSSGQGDGQLIVWFPPFDGEDVTYCKLDIGLTTAQAIEVDDEGRVYVATAFPTSAGVYRYPGPFPTDATPAGGCDGTDATGAPLATDVAKETFVAAGEHGMVTPSGLAFTAEGHLLVSSVITGTINEYDAAGAFVRTILQPPAGEAAGPVPITTGTPLGIDVGPDGTVYYADIGIVGTGIADFGPKDGIGTVRRITFRDGEPQPPEMMATGYAFPDAVGVLTR